MRNLFAGMVLTLAVISGSAQASERFHPNHLFIKMKQGQSLVKSPLIRSAKKVAKNIYLVKTRDALALESSLKSNSKIEYVQKDFYGDKKAMPKLEVLDEVQLQMMKVFNQSFSFNDPDVSKLWAFNASAGMDVNSSYSSLPNRTAEDIIVAVVDTGVDYNHDDLRNVMWVNSGEIAADGIDNDGNGYIDDVHGINTLVRDAEGRATGNPMASHWHGTHVSGTIAAEQNNAIGIAGVASNVKIMAIRTVPDAADELDSDIVESFRYAAKHGAKVINCSFGKSKNEGGMVVRDVINEIGETHNVLVIASAGNDSMGPFNWHNNDVSPKFPASFDSENLLVIASTTSSGGLSTFSNIGKVTVDVGAPGSNIYSTLTSNRYGMASGTSMASPNTSGVAAMVLGYYPEISAVELKQILMNSVTPVSDFSSKISSGGRVNLKAALQKAANL